MNRPYLRDLRADAIALQNEVGDWVVAGVTTGIPWPNIAQVVEYMGLDFIMRPPAEKLMPSIVLNLRKHGLTFEQGQGRIRALGSSLSWYFGHGFEVHHWMGGSRPFGVGEFVGGASQTFLEREVLTVPPDAGAATAFAFYREGLSLRNPFYAFLSMYKVVASIHRDGKARGLWIGNALPLLTDQAATRRMADIATEHGDTGTYLSKQCRHAVAHAELEHFVNPDNAADHRRLESDLPIIKSLAIRAIHEAYGLDPRNPRGATSEIAGIEQWLGESMLKKLSDGVAIEEGELPEPPFPLIVIARRANDVFAIDGMRIDAYEQQDGGLAVWLVNEEKLQAIYAFIDVRQRILRAEPLQGIRGHLNKNSRISIDRCMHLHRFMSCIFGNGKLELWNEKTDQLFGRSDAYIPVNMMSDPKAEQAGFDRLIALREAATED